MSRFVALDAFRGFTIAAMILVNTPGSFANAYAPLKHADWHGWTPTDLVFPFFLFIVGSAMYFSLSSQQQKEPGAVVYRIFKRGFIIFLIGLAINALPLLADSSLQLRIMGVLQRIAIVYIFASLIVVYVGQRFIALISVALLLGYWALLSLSGGLSLHDNIVRIIDLKILGAEHMWKMHGVAFDPEGFLSTLPAIVSTLVGFEVARFLVAQPDKITALKKILPVGIVLIALGLFWEQWLPINKPLWTSSYVVFTSGVAMLLLAAFIWVVDIQNIGWLQKFCVIFGQNALFIYVLSMIWPTILARFISVDTDTSAGVVKSVSGYDWLYSQFMTILSPPNASLLFAVLHVAIFWLAAYWLYRKNILIKI